MKPEMHARSWLPSWDEVLLICSSDIARCQVKIAQVELKKIYPRKNYKACVYIIYYYMCVCKCKLHICANNFFEAYIIGLPVFGLRRGGHGKVFKFQKYRCSNFGNWSAGSVFTEENQLESNRDPVGIQPGHKFCHHFWPTGIESGSSRDPVGHLFSRFWHHFLTCREAAKITQKTCQNPAKIVFFMSSAASRHWRPSRLDPDWPAPLLLVSRANYICNMV